MKPRVHRPEESTITRLRARRACLQMIARGWNPMEIVMACEVCIEGAKTPQSFTRLFQMIDWVSNN